MLSKSKVFKNNKYKLERGAVAVEFALILIPLIILIFAIIEFGIIFNNYIALTHAAREGARLAAVDTYDENKVREAAPSIEIESVTVDGLGGAIGDPVTVTVRGKVINFVIPFITQRSFSLSSSATLRIEWKQP